MKNNVVLYRGESLDVFCIIKDILRQNGIEFKEKTVRKNDGWLRFLFLLFIAETSTYGMNNEHQLEYRITVKKVDFEKAAAIVLKSGVIHH